MPSRVVAAAGRRLRVETDGFAALGTARPEAILHAVSEVGGILKKFFPPRPGHHNQLSDEVSLG